MSSAPRRQYGAAVSDQPNLHDWKPLVEDLTERREKALGMGGPALLDRQRSMGKLPVRERIDLLLDHGSFIEFGQLADSMDPVIAADKGYLAADGMVAGVGLIDGRRVAVCAYDFTVMAGSMGQVGEHKTERLREVALRQRIPIVWLLDSAGARIQASSGSTFAEAGHLFREQVTMSGVVPQVAAMLGHCAAGTAYIPALADFIPMVKGTSSMALGGRHLVKAATGEEVTEEEMGGSEVHTKISGVADLEVASDEECLATVRAYLSFFPSHNQEQPPTRPVSDPVDRRCEELYDIVPTAPRRAYDMRKVIKVVVDDGEVFEMKPGWARNLVTGVRSRRWSAGRHRREPADGARWRARRERRRQGRSVRVALRRVQHPSGLPPRRAWIHRRFRGREAGHHPPRRQDALRGVRGDRAEGVDRAAQVVRRGLLRDERHRLRVPTTSRSGRPRRSR